MSLLATIESMVAKATPEKERKKLSAGEAFARNIIYIASEKERKKLEARGATASMDTSEEGTQEEPKKKRKKVKTLLTTQEKPGMATVGKKVLLGA